MLGPARHPIADGMCKRFNTVLLSVGYLARNMLSHPWGFVTGHLSHPLAIV